MEQFNEVAFTFNGTIAYIDGSRAVCRMGLSYRTNLSKKVGLIDEVIVVLFLKLLEHPSFSISCSISVFITTSFSL